MRDYQELAESDISVYPELAFDQSEGVTAYIETWFDLKKQFSLPHMENEKSLIIPK